VSDGFDRGLCKVTLIVIRIGQPPVMLFFKRAKILSTRLYEFFESGDIDTIAASPDELVKRTNQATFSDLRKSGIHQAFGEFVVHTCIVAVLPRRVERRPHAFTFLPTFGFVLPNRSEPSHSPILVTRLNWAAYRIIILYAWPRNVSIRTNALSPSRLKSALGHVVGFRSNFGSLLETACRPYGSPSATSSPTPPRPTGSAKHAIYRASWCLKSTELQFQLPKPI